MIQIGIILGMVAQTAEGRTAITDLAEGLKTFAEKSTVADLNTRLADATNDALAIASFVASATNDAPASEPDLTFPVQYTTIANALKYIETEFTSKILASNDMITTTAVAIEMYTYIAFNPGVLIYSQYKTIQIENLINLINELKKLEHAIPSKTHWATQSIRKLQQCQIKIEMNRPVKFTWFTAAGLRISVVQMYDGTFREIRHGPLTGNNLKMTGAQIWQNANKLVKHWMDNNISASSVATVYGSY